MQNQDPTKPNTSIEQAQTPESAVPENQIAASTASEATNAEQVAPQLEESKVQTVKVSLMGKLKGMCEVPVGTLFKEAIKKIDATISTTGLAFRTVDGKPIGLERKLATDINASVVTKSSGG